MGLEGVSHKACLLALCTEGKKISVIYFSLWVISAKQPKVTELSFPMVSYCTDNSSSRENRKIIGGIFHLLYIINDLELYIETEHIYSTVCIINTCLEMSSSLTCWHAYG